jgi:hypothetical protein
MNNLENTCQCVCGADGFQMRLKRDEQVGLLTCAAGHGNRDVNTWYGAICA